MKELGKFRLEKWGGRRPEGYMPGSKERLCGRQHRVAREQRISREPRLVAQFCFALLCFTQTRPLRGPPTGPRSPKV